METIKLERTERTPEIILDFANNAFAVRGESYPEDVPSFFGPPVSALEKYLRDLTIGEVTFDFHMTYFNSTSAKVIMKLFEMLDETAARGVTVTINWHFLADDDNLEELGQEFGEDLQSAKLVLCPIQDEGIAIR
ncbi:MAG: DUF1987 domain-containing protein [Magnetococcales bacterium]|nr:DUF1987 domain-containing protein [Magnetococcales bacterium]